MYNPDNKSNYIELVNKLTGVKKGFTYILIGSIVFILPLIGFFGIVLILIGASYIIHGYLKVGETTLPHSNNYKRVSYLLLLAFSMIISSVSLLVYLSVYNFRNVAYSSMKVFASDPGIRSVQMMYSYLLYFLYSNLYLANVISTPLSFIKLFFFGTLMVSIIAYLALSYSLKILKDDLDTPSLNNGYYFTMTSALFIIGAITIFNLYVYYSNTGMNRMPYIYPYIGILLIPVTAMLLAYVFNAMGISYARYGIEEYFFINSVRFEEIENLTASGYTNNVLMAKNIQELQDDLDKKERKLMDKELYLNSKIEELNYKEGNVLADGNVGRSAGNVKKIEKVKTGIARLDDRLYVGYPIGSNILVSGPAHSGKEMFLKMFISENIKNGIPAIVVLTDKSVHSFEEEMEYILPSFHQYVESGMIKYVDVYNAIIGGKKIRNDSKTIHLAEKNNFEEISNAVESFASRLKKNGYQRYCFGFESLSTLIAYTNSTQTFGFLQPFIGKRKMDNATALYIVDAGIHTESDIEILNHAMDGEICITHENVNTYFSIKGITEVQTRSPVNYTITRDNVKLGSFYLDHIR